MSHLHYRPGRPFFRCGRRVAGPKVLLSLLAGVSWCMSKTSNFSIACLCLRSLVREKQQTRHMAAPRKPSRAEQEEEAQREQLHSAIEQRLASEARAEDEAILRSLRKAIEKKLVAQARKDDEVATTVAKRLAAAARQREYLERKRIQAVHARLQAAQAKQRLEIEERRRKETGAEDYALATKVEAKRAAQEKADRYVLRKCLGDTVLAPTCSKLTTRWDSIESLFSFWGDSKICADAFCGGVEQLGLAVDREHLRRLFCQIDQGSPAVDFRLLRVLLQRGGFSESTRHESIPCSLSASASASASTEPSAPSTHASTTSPMTPRATLTVQKLAAPADRRPADQQPAPRAVRPATRRSPPAPPPAAPPPSPSSTTTIHTRTGRYGY